ncbi:MAG: hypothetical protein ACI88A_001089 [Paraglaciecola sp.]|jgi:hypothetical protein
MQSVSLLLESSNLGYRYHANYASVLFFILAMGASYLGWTQLNTDLSFISDNRFIANVFFLSFVIAINERVLEVVSATFRKGTRLEIQRQIEVATNESEKNAWTQTLVRYQAETRRMALYTSLVIGCSLGCLGIVRVFGALTVDEMMVEPLHIAMIDATDIVLTGWVIAGGSEGWNKLTSGLTNLIGTPKKAS